MTSLTFNNIEAINLTDYLAIFGKLQTSAPPLKSFDFSNESTHPAIIITSPENYEKIKQEYQYWPKSKRDLNIYSFDGIKYCKITSESTKSLNGVTMNSIVPKFLSEIVFPTIEYDKNTPIDIYITLDHYNIIQTLNTDEIKSKLLSVDINEFYNNISKFSEIYPNTKIEFITTNNQTNNQFYHLTHHVQLMINHKNTICNYILESILGNVISGHIPLFNGFLMHNSTTNNSIYNPT